MNNPYETDRLVSEYLLFHYGRSEEILPYVFGPGAALDFAVRVVTETLNIGALAPNPRALDLGCAVGRSSFELARHCTEVVGIDYSTAFIRAATQVQTAGKLQYYRVDEGKLTTVLVAEAPIGIECGRMRFERGDACDLRADLGSFDVVLMANLVDRLQEPRRCLARLPELVRPGGQLIIASPFTWLEDYTPIDKWLGGYELNGTRITGFDTLRDLLDPDFEFVARKELPMLIREHVRKFQWSVSVAGVWRRRQ